MSDVLIEIKNISKFYKHVRVEALKDVNLQITQGEFVSITGPSGCGKTTLLNMISVLDSPDRGEIFFKGKPLDAITDPTRFRRQNIGFIFQDYYLIPTLNVIENVLLSVLGLLGTKKTYQQNAVNLLRKLGLEKMMNHDISNLSGGERQRVVIARALLQNPPILLADEPTGNLDSKNGQDVLRLLQKLNQDKGITVVMVTHDPRVANFSTRTIKMLNGKILGSYLSK